MLAERKLRDDPTSVSRMERIRSMAEHPGVPQDKQRWYISHWSLNTMCKAENVAKGELQILCLSTEWEKRKQGLHFLFGGQHHSA